MLLKDLLNNLIFESQTNIPNLEIKGLACDSRQVQPSFLFFAVPGNKLDGKKFIPQAKMNGAAAIVTEEYSSEKDIFQIQVKAVRSAMAHIAANFYHHPSQKLKVVGITGTNGKTTIAYILKNIFEQAGKKCGIIGTIQTGVGDKLKDSVLTTPDAIALQAALSEMKNLGAEYVFMEVSSHALEQKRVEAIKFCAAIFTNLTHEHLDFHKNMENYLKAKKKLFDSLEKDALAVVNQEDKYSQEIIQDCKAKIVFFAKEKVQTNLNGDYNFSNISAALALAGQLGIDRKIALKAVEEIVVPGRFEKISNNKGFDIIVDFAHTPDALEKLLLTVRQNYKGKIILVFGCPGERDKGKRPMMGEIAGKLADFSIVTTDDPYSEEEDAIAKEIISGFVKSETCLPTGTVRNPKVKIIIDRKAALQSALSMAKKGDVVVVAGRGHEKHQTIKSEKIPFDDRVEIRKLLDSNA